MSNNGKRPCLKKEPRPKKRDVNVEELVSVIQKQKDQLQLKEDEILRLKKLMAEIREKKREYIG